MTLDRQAILRLIPHQGASCLIDACPEWDAQTLVATTRAHLLSDNPLRQHGRLGPIVGAEMAMQAAALHGALTAPHGGPPGYLAGLRDLDLACERLDEPAYETLRIEVFREQADQAGLIYRFTVSTEAGTRFVSGRGTVMLRASGTLS
ncbi:phosphotransferase [Tanticharoenia sakaeratensis]|uniref:Phosphotransferase n=1 Tax=Tanticharoenia sakaeratensis NBRC 103193 TaxID=1231623 RepID=A0A0D6MKQ4_9PROT|nr:phosphotransferase [Tanticharoenia sakaeratensis]GAN54056.1 phosphotransferase [Tanticharoenia sakaeratensis NBRC 103193]GBQ23714.1 phosphotransferase [Tanticharoenia sakaeratensis NBRC 103193]